MSTRKIWYILVSIFVNDNGGWLVLDDASRYIAFVLRKHTYTYHRIHYRLDSVE
jgi:hypothetical protein